MSTQLSSRKLDISGSRKKSLCTGGTGKKFTKKGKTHKQKSAAAAVSVTEEVNDLHNVEDTSTATAHSFVSEQQKGLKATSKSAEQKRALIERKRLEKKQLEEERLLKEKENLRLQELLEKQRQEHLQQQEKTDTNNNIDDNDMLSKIKCPYVTPGQVSGLAALERQRVLEERLELSVVDEALKAKADQRDHEVDELLQRAKEAEATFVAELKEHERLQRLKKEEEEKQLIAMEAKKLETENEARRKLEEEKKKRATHNKAMNLDLLSCRMNQGISRPWTYSYFQYVPVQRKENNNSKKKVTKTRTSKRK